MAYQTSSNNYLSHRYVVGVGIDAYPTIQAAINAANAAGGNAVVYIRPGTYTENLTLYSTVSLEGAETTLVAIIGQHTPPTTGSISFTRIEFRATTTDSVLLNANAGTTAVKFTRCSFVVADGYICNLDLWTGNILFRYCAGGASVKNGVVYNTGGSKVEITNSLLGSGTTRVMTVSGITLIDNGKISCPITLSGSAVSVFEGGSTFEGTITTANTVDLQISNSRIPTGTATAITHASSVVLKLSNTVVDTTNAVAIAGTGSVKFSEATFPNSKALAGTITEVLTGVVKTGEIYADTIQRMEQTGFYSWAAAAPYFSDTTLGTFDLLVGGTGYVKGKLVTWLPATLTGMTSGATWFIYVTAAGVVSKTTTRNDALFVDNICLFESLYDETPTTKQQHTVRENHAYNFPVSASNYLHDTVGAIIENASNGAVIAPVAAANVKVMIVGADVLTDHGLDTDIPDSGGAGVVWKRFYTNAAGKWAVQNTTDTFAGYYNNAGTPTVLSGSRFGVYTLYVGKDTGNSAAPTYYAVMNTAQYNTSGAASTAISNGTTSIATGELKALELAQLGYIIFSQSSGSITSTIVSKSTLKATVSGGSGTNIASLITTVTSAFDGILSGADSNVQSALQTINDWGKTTTDHTLLIGNGTGVAIGSLAVGSTGEVLVGNSAADPSWSATVLATTFDTNVVAAGVTLAGTTLSADGTDANININITSKGTGQVIIDDLQLTADLAVTEGGTGASALTDHGVLIGSGTGAITPLSVGGAGVILTGVAASDPTWTTATYPATIGIGELLHGSAANVIGGLGIGTTGKILRGVTGAAPAWSTATYPDTAAIGDVLIATSSNVIAAVSGAATATWVLTANGSGTSPTFQAPGGGGGGLAWSVETANMTAAVDKGYIANKAGLLTFTLPATAAAGKVFRFSGMNTAVGWRVAQASGQTIYFGSLATTTGVGGYLEATAIRDAVEIVCVTADTNFNVVSCIGNITVV